MTCRTPPDWPTGTSVRGTTGVVEGPQELGGPLGGPAVPLLQALEVSAALGAGLAFLDGLGVRIDRLDVQAVLTGERLERALRQVGHAHSVACPSVSRHLVRPRLASRT